MGLAMKDVSAVCTEQKRRERECLPCAPLRMRGDSGTVPCSPQIAEKLIQAFAEQIFYTGFIHSDPHPGNVLVRKGPDGKAQLVLLDHGLYQFLDKK